MTDYRTHAERLRAIREERPSRTYTVTYATQPSNRHADDDEAARDRFLRDINRRPRCQH
jgi:uncharacterized protein YjiK